MVKKDQKDQKCQLKSKKFKIYLEPFKMIMACFCKSFIAQGKQWAMKLMKV